MESAKKRESSAGYHHGDLRNALIVAAAELIEESGSDDFAMVDAARRAGVSSAAPYRHFTDRDDLLSAVAEVGYYDLALRLRTVQDQYDIGSVAAIVALGKCYVQFVITRPAFFDLLWGERGSRILANLNEKFEDQHANGFSLLVNQVRAWIERENVASVVAEELALKMWAMTIGTSHMAINYDLERFVERIDLEEIVESSTIAFLQGVKGAP